MTKDFEKEYYEAEHFWESHSLADADNTLRINETVRLVPASAKNIADIGCGNGLFINQLRRERPELTTMAFDRSSTALRYVQGDKKEGSIEHLDFADRSFDCVSCLEVIEHLPLGLYEQALGELARISDKYLIISVPYDEDLEMDANQCPSCKTVFNANLHLRRYDKATFEHLFDQHGFRCVNSQLLGKRTTFKYHDRYRRMFYPQQFRQWLAPICPVCGYQKAPESAAATPASTTHSVSPARRALGMVSALPKALWPKEDRYYWILGLFERK
jgi:ubiquinone/menaquinone biosynthesis C-methylase UbiE